MFQIKQTPNAGRAVFATSSIPTNTHLLTSTDLSIAVTYREYKREVCEFCYAYDRGKHWNVRVGKAGLAWCSEACKEDWVEGYGGGDIALDAHEAMEGLIRRMNRGGRGAADDEDEDEDDERRRRRHDNTQPTQLQIETAWKSAEEIAMIIIASRSTINPTRLQTRAISKLSPPDANTLNYLLVNILAQSTLQPDEWDAIIALHPTSTIFPTNHILSTYITAYHHLLSILPLPLLANTTPSTFHTIISRDAHNSFGIRSLDDGGSEMFGHGIWPTASYWNHSCSPTVSKKRIGRRWVFKTERDVEDGEELSISYLGGDERDLGVVERRDQLWGAWKFRCGCSRCVEEGGE